MVKVQAKQRMKRIRLIIEILVFIMTSNTSKGEWQNLLPGEKELCVNNDISSEKLLS